MQFGDLARFVEFDYVARVAQVNVAALAALARGPRAPRNTAIVTTRLTNDTDLRWDANPEPDISGYEVVWRATTEPTWTDSRLVGNVTSFTVEGMSKDNVQFGVRAIDRQGHRSPVSFPVPAS
ncbi:M28 family metallopeptidase [Nonomuraea sp. NPDC050556]|uniref:M28 family metallopeptidase n=1 Tax=Nonomuraea sp. NPDC050556 TaxID=3364369 RepID=UPI0037A6BE6E